eukprot:m.310225 g.310225  ORF g.310225 m.310225 type:complete len:424 (+) comp50303_c0_seq1:65-1336(+)
MEFFVSEAKRIFGDIERFLLKIAKKLPTALDRERDVLVEKISELMSTAEAAERRRTSTSVSRGKVTDPGYGKRSSLPTLSPLANPRQSFSANVDIDPESVRPEDDMYMPPEPSSARKPEPIEEEQYLAVSESEPQGEYLTMHKIPAPADNGRRNSKSPAPGRKKGKQKEGMVLMKEISQPQQIGVLKRRKEKVLGGKKWIEQTVVVKDDKVYVADKDADEVGEVHVLTDCTVEQCKKEKQQQHIFQIKLKSSKTLLMFAVGNVAELQDWMRVIKRAAIPDAQSHSEADEDEIYEVPGEDEESKAAVLPVLRPVPVARASSDTRRDSASSRRFSIPVDTSTIYHGRVHHQDKRAPFDAVYVAAYDCAAECADEVSLQRGDLIWIDFKNHNDWWVGTVQAADGLFKGKRGFVPSAYLAPAYEKCA